MVFSVRGKGVPRRQARLWWMITRRVECLNGLSSVVSTSWQLLEDGSGRGDFWACYPCRWKRKKVARWEGCVRVVAGSRGKVLGDAWARQCGRQQSQALCKVVVRVTGHAHQVEGDGLQSGIADAPRPESWQVHLS